MDDDLHPQAAAALERREKLPLSSLRRVGVRPLRLLMRASSWWQNRDPPAVGRVVDRSIPGPDGDLRVRLYRPEGDGPFPTVVFYHGGGFVLGSIESHDLFCRHLTRESGCVVVSVDYRLAPEHPFPAAVEDASAALEWAADNPDALAGTGDLAVVGDSAGGTLAAVAALMAAERDGPDVDYQYLLYPGVGVEEDQASVREHAGKVLAEDDLQWFRECYYGSEIHERNPYADPTNACDLSGVAPATVLTAGFDPLRDGGRRYADQLAADGVPTRHVEYEDVIHGFATMLSAPDLDRAHEAVADVADDLRAAFGDA
ncbi:alpha/beta hydrolase fold domain-containing protein [Halobacterium sp. R2-5]|uniref:alpha/beta hydrolase n=1 Tax=Halobacterium sp. R2-5 TaxID=2715751 RepID=UPI00142180D6|nr:alpha/beta hydrolase fold domain-containing protein [Halobacterium sp. R2-5]NIB98441.1 alpha/beta hydrolase fold domain-containing protein [Halobacterium sp. R2-5]